MKKNNKKNSKNSVKEPVILTDFKDISGRLGSINWTLDYLRNGIFNVASSLNYVKNLSIDAELFNKMSSSVADIEQCLNQIVGSLNLKFGEKLEVNKNENEQ